MNLHYVGKYDNGVFTESPVKEMSKEIFCDGMGSQWNYTFRDIDFFFYRHGFKIEVEDDLAITKIGDIIYYFTIS